MKKSVLNTILLCFFIGSLTAQRSAVKEVSIESAELNQTRDLLIFTPINYDHSEYYYYNVIYVFDAHDRPLYDYVTSVSHLLREGQRGFIVVGIKATYIKELMYGRNHDLLPSDTERNLGPKSGGNAEAFLAYVKNEVVPYVESNYRVLPHRTGVGHSLSASFLIYSMLNEPDLFDNFIAVSPNLADDDQRLVKDLDNFDSAQFNSLHYLYMNHADDYINYPGWGAANDKAYPILKNKLANENFKVVTEQFPDESHMSGYMPAVKSALSTLIDSVLPVQNKQLSENTYELTFRVKVPDDNDVVYITGNQESLGNWEPGLVRMERVSPLEREITVKVQDPVEVKFTRGSWESEAWINIGDGRTTFPMIIRPEASAEYSFEILGFRN
ncbi:alpha/beta hydrolase-fold protein [Robiginitalea sp. IMCC44478]|uniref:alpha/beta hydrolase-fold protein n=1 Tax=Robiginitalea sp. IMCC44478 TaxID=3459122 RepID=UPI004042A183